MILHSLSAYDAFAETYAFCDVPLMADVTAALDCRILFINTGSALSKELAKMKKEGILDFHKNHFRLLKTDPV